jgi:hypothetical protein
LEETHVSELTDEGIVLDDGGLLTWPDCQGLIRRLNPYRDCVEHRIPGDDGYDDWFGLFPVDVIEVEYTVGFRHQLRLARGRYHLRHELGELTPPEGPCTAAMAGTLRVQTVMKNGRELPLPADVGGRSG